MSFSFYLKTVLKISCIWVCSWWKSQCFESYFYWLHSSRLIVYFFPLLFPSLHWFPIRNLLSYHLFPLHIMCHFSLTPSKILFPLILIMRHLDVVFFVLLVFTFVEISISVFFVFIKFEKNCIVKKIVVLSFSSTFLQGLQVHI